jgi:hypothetical protein
MCAGCGLLHPRTARSTAYDLVQMMALFYIVAMVPVRTDDGLLYSSALT